MVYEFKNALLQRHPENPIITPKMIPNSFTVFNPSPVRFRDGIAMLVSVLPRDNDPYIIPAFSTDGVHFRIADKPLITRPTRPPFKDLDIWTIDPRVTHLEGTYYITYPGSTRTHGTMGFLGKTDDFEHFELLEVISLPDNRSPVLFPEKIDGSYVRLDRPCSRTNEGTVWISFSPDLIHWGRHRPLLGTDVWWAPSKVGPGGPPIRTPHGWLVVYHGVIVTASGATYSLGAALLDLKDPSRVLGKTKGYILTPDEPYERTGFVPNVVFTNGAIADPANDLIHVYYGAADTCIGLATGSIDAIIKECLA